MFPWILETHSKLALLGFVTHIHALVRLDTLCKFTEKGKKTHMNPYTGSSYTMTKCVLVEKRSNLRILVLKHTTSWPLGLASWDSSDGDLFIRHHRFQAKCTTVLQKVEAGWDSTLSQCPSSHQSEGVTKYHTHSRIVLLYYYHKWSLGKHGGRAFSFC